MRAGRLGAASVSMAAMLWGATLSARAQAPGTVRPMGSVSAADADVTNGPAGTLRVAGDRVQLVGSSTVTARDHTAPIGLTRGGSINVCRSSALHLTQAVVSGGIPPLLLALDRGAIEVHMISEPGDAILTPDLRLATPRSGMLELKLHVSASGDTCVDNVGDGPVVNITDAFGETSYEVKPGQHVLFEHGDLRAVVDRESSPCGCPAAEKPGVSIAEAMLASHGTMTPEAARAVHPFPAAVSSGLAPPTPAPPEAGGTHVQVATTLSYDPSAPVPPAEAESGEDSGAAATALERGGTGAAKRAAAPVAPAAVETQIPERAPTAVAPVPSVVSAPVPVEQAERPKAHSQPNPFRAIGHFFKHLFVR